MKSWHKKIIFLFLYSFLLSSCYFRNDNIFVNPELAEGKWKHVKSNQVINIKKSNDGVYWLDFMNTKKNVRILSKNINGIHCIFLSDCDDILSEEDKLFLMFKILKYNNRFVLYEHTNSSWDSKKLKRIAMGKSKIDDSEFDHDDPKIFVRISRSQH